MKPQTSTQSQVPVTKVEVKQNGEKHNATQGDDRFVWKPGRVDLKTREIFEEVKVRRAEALRLLADH